MAAPVAFLAYRASPDAAWWTRAGQAVAYLLGFPAVTAYLALNFTGATPLTSQTGVKREMLRYVPAMAWMAGLGILLTLALAVTRWIGG